MSDQGKWLKKVKDVLDVSAEGGVSIAGSIAEGMFGQVAPGLTTIYFSYKQKRSEKNMIRFRDELGVRQNEIVNRLSKSEEKLNNLDNVIKLVMGYVVDEPQEKKICYMVNGIVNLSGHEEIKEDFVLLYYDTLKELRLVDIGILKFYYDIDTKFDQDTQKTHSDVLEELGITYEQYDAIREKLNRMGLLGTKRDAEMDQLVENLNKLKDYIDKVSKGKNAKISIKKLSRRDKYTTSRFGRDFVSFFLKKYGE